MTCLRDAIGFALFAEDPWTNVRTGRFSQPRLTGQLLQWAPQVGDRKGGSKIESR